MTDERQQDTRSRLTASRRHVRAAVAPAAIAGRPGGMKRFMSFVRHGDHGTLLTGDAVVAARKHRLGGTGAALDGDLVVVANEVRPVLVALRRGGAELVEAHHHDLSDEPHLFFVHYRAVGDPVRPTEAARRAVDVTNVVPMPGGAG
ncbi:DUF1259 domain-containing protein [Streptomyces sp. NPDC101234]|uniref:DUF1259 domain-containing protein n=1 Tax=Streptomyces sp. NPDC101234 TaxID=3366138 RepID=UPI0038165B5C